MKSTRKTLALMMLLLLPAAPCFCWGFYAHQRINQLAVFLLPPEMMVLFKPQINFLSEHAVDPDKRRYAVAEEGPRHYIDIDRYGSYPYAVLPHSWKEAVARFGEDSLMQHGIIPWHIQTVQYRLTDAFRKGDFPRFLKRRQSWDTILPMPMCRCMPAATTTDNTATRKAFMVFGKAGYRNCWLKPNSIFLSGKRPTSRHAGIYLEPCA